MNPCFVPQIIYVFLSLNDRSVNLSREIKTAIFALSGFGLFFIGFNYLKSNDVFVRDNIFFAVYDNAEGLMVGTPVTIQGFQVGTIDQVSLLQEIKMLPSVFVSKKNMNFQKIVSQKFMRQAFLVESPWLLIQSLMALISQNQETLCKAQLLLDLRN